MNDSDNIFKPLAWQIAPWSDKSRVLLLTGSAGGGKSTLATEKLHAFCLKYPSATGLLLRKVRQSMNNSTLLFFKRYVVGNNPNVIHRPSDFRFEYKNGSILAYGGMKDEEQREQIRSIGQKGGVDIALMEEAVQFEEEDFNEVLARMRGTATNWTQIILSTNPGPPAHWINSRLILGGEASVYFSTARDNSYNPESYYLALDSLTGVQKQRLAQGLWVQGTGSVYDTWLDIVGRQTRGQDMGNVTEEADYREGDGQVIWAVDDGYTGQIEKSGFYSSRSHPRAFLFCQVRANGQVAIFDEHYSTKLTAEAHIKQVIEFCQRRSYPLPDLVIRDRAAAALGGSLEDAGIGPVRYVSCPIEEGIQKVREFISADENSFRRTICHPRAKNLRYEMASYCYDENGRPIKAHDHGPDIVRYLSWFLSNDVHEVDVATIEGSYDG